MIILFGMLSFPYMVDPFNNVIVITTAVGTLLSLLLLLGVIDLRRLGLVMT